MAKKSIKFVKTILIILILAAVVIMLALVVKRKKAALADAPVHGDKPTIIHTAISKTASLDIKQEYLAIVEPIGKTEVSSQILAEIENLYVDEGDIVAEGQILAKLDSRQIKDYIKQIQAKIEQSKAELAANEELVNSTAVSFEYWSREASRSQQLLSTGAMTKSETEAVNERKNDVKGKLNSIKQKSKAIEHGISALKHNLSELQIKLSYTQITSPYAGVVTAKYSEIGDKAIVGKPIFEIEDQKQLKISFDIPQQDIQNIQENSYISFKQSDKWQKSQITVLYPSLNKSRMLRAECNLTKSQSESLKSGMWLTVYAILNNIEQAVIIPSNALIPSPEGKNYVFVVKEKHLEPIAVEVIGKDGDFVAINGIDEQTEVVVSTFLGWSKLSSDLEIEVAR